MNLVLEVRKYAKENYDLFFDKNKYYNASQLQSLNCKRINTVAFRSLYKLFINECKSKFLHQINECKIKILKDKKTTERSLKWKKLQFNVGRFTEITILILFTKEARGIL